MKHKEICLNCSNLGIGDKTKREFCLEAFLYIDNDLELNNPICLGKKFKLKKSLSEPKKTTKKRIQKGKKSTKKTSKKRGISAKKSKSKKTTKKVKSQSLDYFLKRENKECVNCPECNKEMKKGKKIKGTTEFLCECGEIIYLGDKIGRNYV